MVHKIKRNYGLSVLIKYNRKCPFDTKEETLHNVTEIHYNHKRGSMSSNEVAFESDIHQTGLNRKIEWIDEFETRFETKKAKEF